MHDHQFELFADERTLGDPQKRHFRSVSPAGEGRKQAQLFNSDFTTVKFLGVSASGTLQL